MVEPCTATHVLGVATRWPSVMIGNLFCRWQTMCTCNIVIYQVVRLQWQEASSTLDVFCRSAFRHHWHANQTYQRLWSTSRGECSTTEGIYTLDTKLMSTPYFPVFFFSIDPFLSLPHPHNAYPRSLILCTRSKYILSSADINTVFHAQCCARSPYPSSNVKMGLCFFLCKRKVVRDLPPWTGSSSISVTVQRWINGQPFCLTLSFLSSLSVGQRSFIKFMRWCQSLV